MTAPTETTLKQPEPHSRRALMAGALGGLGVWVASVVGRAMPAEAAAGDPIRMGRTNRAGGTQTILETDSPGAAFLVRQGSRAQAIRAEANSGRAVMGVGGSNGTGLWGYSPNHNAVFASTDTGYCLQARAQGTGSVGALIYATGTNSLAIDAYGPSRLNGRLILSESSPGAAPSSNQAVLFARDDGTGKTELCVRFATGDVQVIAVQP